MIFFKMSSPINFWIFFSSFKVKVEFSGLFGNSVSAEDRTFTEDATFPGLRRSPDPIRFRLDAIFVGLDIDVSVGVGFGDFVEDLA